MSSATPYENAVNARTPSRMPTVPKEFNFATSARTPRSGAKSAHKLGKPMRKPLRAQPKSPNVRLKRKTPSRRKKIESIHEGKALRVRVKEPKSCSKERFRAASGDIFEQGHGSMTKKGNVTRKSIYAGPERVQRRSKRGSKKARTGGGQRIPHTSFASRVSVSRRDDEFRPARPDLFGAETPKATAPAHRVTMHAAATEMQHARHQQRRTNDAPKMAALPERMTLATRPSALSSGRKRELGERFTCFALSPPHSISPPTSSATPYRPVGARMAAPHTPMADTSMQEPTTPRHEHTPMQMEPIPSGPISLSSTASSALVSRRSQPFCSPISRVNRMDNARVLDALTGVIINKSYQGASSASAGSGSILHTPSVQKLLSRAPRTPRAEPFLPRHTPSKGTALAALRRQQSVFRSSQRPQAVSRLARTESARTPAPRWKGASSLREHSPVPMEPKGEQERLNFLQNRLRAIEEEEKRLAAEIRRMM